MPADFALPEPGSATRRGFRASAPRLGRAAGVIASLVVLGVALRLSFGSGIGGFLLEAVQRFLFGSLAWVTAASSLVWSALMFREIVVAYRRAAGFPWLSALSFGAAAFDAIMALHASIS
jgi:hypothetical protein